MGFGLYGPKGAWGIITPIPQRTSIYIHRRFLYDDGRSRTPLPVLLLYLLQADILTNGRANQDEQPYCGHQTHVVLQ